VAAGDVPTNADALYAGSASLPAGAVTNDPALTPVTVERIASGFYLRHGKRVFDVLAATILLMVLLPVAAIVALAVLFTSGWPVLYRSSRVGLDGRPFRMWKFRTMVRDADAASRGWAETDPGLARELETRWKVKSDPRVTRVGGVLRRSSLDELPQIVNVLRGEMSIVGPRPYLPHESLDQLLSPSILAVRPGLTGPFQTRGRNGLMPIERQKLEASYWRDVSFANDVRYVLRTVQPLLRMDGH
jgi:lipopolysaccharide/colanic/teichoic acid biosynthesis glycosyltransferase